MKILQSADRFWNRRAERVLSGAEVEVRTSVCIEGTPDEDQELDTAADVIFSGKACEFR